MFPKTWRFLDSPKLNFRTRQSHFYLSQDIPKVVAACARLCMFMKTNFFQVAIRVSQCKYTAMVCALTFGRYVDLEFRL